MTSRIDKNSWILKNPIAHRGLHTETKPENSKASFLHAIEQNKPIEFDLQITLDEKVVCFHDDNLKRVTGVDDLIWNKTYDEIKDLSILNTDENIMLFEDFLKLVSGQVPLLIEIKSCANYKKMMDIVLDLLANYKGEFAIQSFDPRVLVYLKKNEPNYLRGQLVTLEKPTTVNFLTAKLLSMCALNFLTKPDFINMCVDNLPVKKRLRKKYHILCWTVNNETKHQLALEYSDNFVYEKINLI